MRERSCGLASDNVLSRTTTHSQEYLILLCQGKWGGQVICI